MITFDVMRDMSLNEALDYVVAQKSEMTQQCYLELLRQSRDEIRRLDTLRAAANAELLAVRYRAR